MLVAKHDHVIEELPAYAPDESLGCSVLPWTSECRAFRVDLEALDRTGHRGREDRVVVVNQESMARFIGEGLAQLLDDPAGGGALGNVEVQDSSMLLYVKRLSENRCCPTY